MRVNECDSDWEWKLSVTTTNRNRNNNITSLTATVSISNLTVIHFCRPCDNYCCYNDSSIANNHIFFIRNKSIYRWIFYIYMYVPLIHRNCPMASMYDSTRLQSDFDVENFQRKKRPKNNKDKTITELNNKTKRKGEKKKRKKRREKNVSKKVSNKLSKIQMILCCTVY